MSSDEVPPSMKGARPAPPRRREAASRRAKRAARQVRSREVVAADPALEPSGLLELVGYNVRRADIFLHQHFASTLAEQAIRPAEYSVMSLIAAGAHTTQADIAHALSIKPPNLVGLVLRLERRGVLRREIDARDRRNHVLSLTRQGKLLLARMSRLVRDQDRRVTQCWSDAEREQLLTLLQRLHRGQRGNGAA